MRKMGTKAADLPGKCNLYVSDYTYDATVSREPPGHYLEKTAARVPFWQPFHRDGLLAHRAWSPRCYGPVPGAGVFKCLVVGGIVLVLASAAPSWLILRATALKKYRPYKANSIASRKAH